MRAGTGPVLDLIASRSPPGLGIDRVNRVPSELILRRTFRDIFGVAGVIFCTLGVIFELILGPWRHLGVTIEALWMHFSCQKTDWGAKGAPRGVTPVSGSPFWAPFWSFWGDFLRFEKRLIFYVVLEHLLDRPGRLNGHEVL